MSASLNIKAYSDKNNPEFKKHLEAVEFCIERNLSFPKETSEFFKGKVGGEDLEDIRSECILDYIENGVEIPLVTIRQRNEIILKTVDIPKEVVEIRVTLS
jgi:hypothetical protein